MIPFSFDPRETRRLRAAKWTLWTSTLSLIALLLSGIYIQSSLRPGDLLWGYWGLLAADTATVGLTGIQLYRLGGRQT
jgi:hypothetical protein